MAKHKTFGRPEAVWNRLGGEDGVDAFLACKTKVVPVGGNTLIFDSLVAATYPDWVDLGWDKHEKYVLRGTGPTAVDLSSIIPYLHPKQKNGGHVVGTELYEFLKTTGLIEHCLDLRFGEELVKQPHLFPSALKGKYLPLWKSVVRHHDGDLHVPYVCEDGGSVYVGWLWLDVDFYDNNPAVLSAS